MPDASEPYFFPRHIGSICFFLLRRDLALCPKMGNAGNLLAIGSFSPTRYSTSWGGLDSNEFTT